MGFSLLRMLAIYAVIVALMFIFQRQLQYYPDKNMQGGPLRHGVPEMQEISVRTEDGLVLFGWYAPPKDKKPVIVFFHGNAGHIGHRAFKARALMDAGFGVLLAEYRGYGGNPGSPSEEGFYKDGRAFIKWLKDGGLPENRVVIYGESIGSGAAVEMAAAFKDVAGLVLETPFSSAVDVGKKAYWWLPVDLLMKDRFDNAAKINQVKAPLLILHGLNDRTVPVELARKLFAQANDPKAMVEFENGDHNGLYDLGAFKPIREFLDRL